MTRVVIDTSVLISGILAEHGAPAAVLALIGTGEFIWYVSTPVLMEYQ